MVPTVPGRWLSQTQQDSNNPRPRTPIPKTSGCASLTNWIICSSTSEQAHLAGLTESIIMDGRPQPLRPPEITMFSYRGYRVAFGPTHGMRPEWPLGVRVLYKGRPNPAATSGRGNFMGFI